MIRERQRTAISGWVMLPILLVLAAVAFRFLFLALQAKTIVGVLVAMLLVVATVICFGGFFVVNPNEGRVLQLFGAYNGTVRTPGLRWASPFYTKKHVSLRVRNFESGKLKVNDFDGNPIEIAAVVVWRVTDTAEAVFEVDNFENYVKVQTESAIRNLATRYPYDTHEDEKVSLRGNTAAVAAAQAAAVGAGARLFATIPGDVPCVTAEEISALVARGPLISSQRTCRPAAVTPT